MVEDPIPPGGELPPGTPVGDYRVDRKIGQGAYGEVYRLVHPVIGRAAAAKVLMHDAAADAKAVARFAREARAVNEIAHPNIVDIFGFGTLEDGRHYCLMELLEGQSLAAHVEAQGTLSLDEVLAIFRPLARALDAAHARGVIHRDLKPANVFLIRGAPGVKLLDFGIAKLLGGDASSPSETSAEVVIGTPNFMSPEQVRREGVDHSTDIYALGVMAYRLLTGRLPFLARGTADVLAQHLRDTPPHPSLVNRAIARPVGDVVMRMLAKRAADRPASASAAVDALEAARRQRSPRSRAGVWGAALVAGSAALVIVWLGADAGGPAEHRPAATLPGAAAVQPHAPQATSTTATAARASPAPATDAGGAATSARPARKRPRGDELPGWE